MEHLKKMDYHARKRDNLTFHKYNNSFASLHLRVAPASMRISLDRFTFNSSIFVNND